VRVPLLQGVVYHFGLDLSQQIPKNKLVCLSVVMIIQFNSFNNLAVSLLRMISIIFPKIIERF